MRKTYQFCSYRNDIILFWFAVTAGKSVCYEFDVLSTWSAKAMASSQNGQKTSPNEKKERCGSLTVLQCQIFTDFLRTGQKPGTKVFRDAGLLDDPPKGKLGRFGRFRAWSRRMSVRESDNALLFKKSGKIILPREHYVHAIKHIHYVEFPATLRKHLHYTATLAKVLAVISAAHVAFYL
jgi:hypothetical protein